jgi:NIMA (never in mitosis gene a)-related kinase
MEKYKKIDIIGKGSFGYAVLVESRKTKKQFIIKVFYIINSDY